MLDFNDGTAVIPLVCETAGCDSPSTEMLRIEGLPYTVFVHCVRCATKLKKGFGLMDSELIVTIDKLSNLPS